MSDGRLRSGWVGRVAVVVVSSGCGDADGVGSTGEPGTDDIDPPAGHFAGVVAAGAGAAAPGTRLCDWEEATLGFAAPSHER
jgi:hypothetical protein